MAALFASPFRASARRARARDIVLLAATVAAAGCPSGRSGTHPTSTVSQAGSARSTARLSDAALEREVLAELNRARTNPSKYAEYLESTIKLYDGMLLRRPTDPMATRTREGIPAVREAIKVLRSLEPMSAFEVSSGMTEGARDHVRDSG